MKMHPEVYETFIDNFAFEVIKYCEDFNTTELTKEVLTALRQVAMTQTKLDILEDQSELLDKFGIIPIRKGAIN